MKNISIKFLSIFISILFFGTVQAQKKLTFTEKYKVPTTTVKNQHRTGTCWSYATMSFIETEAIRKGKPKYDLAEMYIVNYAFRSKADLYVRLHGNANFSEGGQAHDVLNEMVNYGIVPESVYKGIEYEGVHNHSKMVKELEVVVKEVASKDFIESISWKDNVNDIINSYLGKPTKKFTFKNKKYTPKSFMTEALDFKCEDYIEFTSFSHHPYNTGFDLEVPDNWSHDFYYNLPIENLITIMDSALMNGYSINWDGDVSNDGFIVEKSIAILTKTDKKALKKMSMEEYRQQTFNNFVTTDDHLMHIVGITYDQNNKKYYITKNSWGKYNEYGGYLYMSEDYVKLNTIAFMVNKEAVASEYLPK